MSNINKERTLRAFTVENTTETKANIDLLRMLRISLEDQKTLEDRLMPLTSEKKGESDLLTSWKLETNMLSGIIRPVLPKDLTSDLPATFLNKEYVTTEELIHEATKSEVFTTLPPCYFGISDKHIVLLCNNKYSHRRFETYINWLLREVRKDYFIKLLEVISLPDESILSTTSSIIIGSDTKISISEPPSPLQKVLKKMSASAWNIISGLDGFNDLNINLEDILDLSILLKVKRKKLKKEEKEHQLSKIARMFSHEDNVSIKTRRGLISIDKQMKRKKSIVIEMTSEGAINESILFADIEKFLTELKE